MRAKIVTLQYSPTLGGFDERPLADFVRDKQVLAVREHFFTVHDLPHLSCLITWQESPLPAGRDRTDHAPNARERAAGRPDPTADLDETERTLFATLREWRAAKARKEGTPPYVIFTNRELVALVRARPDTRAALTAVEGVGAAKVERYGAELLTLLCASDGEGPDEAAPRAAVAATADSA